MRIVFSLESKILLDMIFNNSFCMSWWLYLFPILPSKWAICFHLSFRAAPFGHLMYIFGITTWYEAAFLWQYVCWCSSKHCGTFFPRTKSFGSVCILYIPLADQCSFLPLRSTIEADHRIKSMKENGYSCRSDKKVTSFFVNERVE